MYVVIYGMSGSGKTTVAQELSTYLHENSISSTILSLDYFYKEGRLNSYDVPEAFDWEKVKVCLNSINDTGSCTLYPYRYDVSKYDLHIPIKVVNADVIILEGIYANFAKFLLLDDLIVIRINTEPDVCLMRRLIRDEACRGISMKDNLTAWKEKVKPGWNQWNQPDILAESALSYHYEVSGEDRHQTERFQMYKNILFDVTF